MFSLFVLFIFFVLFVVGLFSLFNYVSLLYSVKYFEIITSFQKPFLHLKTYIIPTSLHPITFISKLPSPTLVFLSPLSFSTFHLFPLLFIPLSSSPLPFHPFILHPFLLSFPTSPLLPLLFISLSYFSPSLSSLSTLSFLFPSFFSPSLLSPVELYPPSTPLPFCHFFLTFYTESQKTLE